MYVDINECEINSGGCDQNCTNTIGSFICNCVLGYELDEDEVTCNGKYEWRVLIFATYMYSYVNELNYLFVCTQILMSVRLLPTTVIVMPPVPTQWAVFFAPVALDTLGMG